MNTYRIFAVFWLVLGVLNPLPAASVTQHERQDGLREKVYLHLDKAFYMPGEILWFKAYLVDARDMKPVDVSNVVYVELINAEGEKVLQDKISVGAGQSNSGSLFIHAGIMTGRYRVVAYTALMQNYGPASFFSGYIDVVNLLQESPPVRVASGPAILRFFPESGRMLNGVETQVAFKLEDAYGLGRAFRATVFEGDSLPVAHLEANGFGIGKFTFTPRSGAHYTVRLEDAGPRAEALLIDFPETVDDGYLFNVERTAGEGARVRIAGTSQHVNETLTLLAHTSTGSVQSWTVRLDLAAQTTLELSGEDTPIGLSVLTLLCPQGQPVAERLVYKPGAPEQALQTSLAKATASTRTALQLSVHIEAALLADSPDLSLSVLKIDDLQDVPKSHIGTYLHLNSELSGHVENMGYDWGLHVDSSRDDLDVFLLTQTWRQVAPVPKARRVAEYQSHALSVRFTDRVTGQPLPNEMAFLAVPATAGATYVATTDSTGVATFSVRKLRGNKQIITRLATPPYGAYDAAVISPYAPTHERVSAPHLVRDEYLQTDVLARSVEMQANQVYHRRERGRYRPADESLIPFFGSGDITYWLDDFTRFVLMEEVLREYITEVSVRRSQSDYHLRVLDKDNNAYFDGPPLILLDGVPLMSANDIIGYDPLQVERIDVVTGKYYYGQGVYDGVISFSTYDRRLDGFEPDGHLKVLNYDGLQYERQFYVPPYGDGNTGDSRLPDFRNVLYWEPRLAFDEQGMATISVATSDLPGNYAIVIQGIDNRGRVAYHIDYFRVE